MFIQIDNIKLTPAHTEEKIPEILFKQFKIQTDSYKILKKSLDARDKNDILYIYRILIEVTPQHGAELVTLPDITEYIEPEQLPAKKAFSKEKIIIVGAGPAGLFCALRLIESGLKVTIIERGKPVEERIKDIAALEKTGLLNEESNVLFGEGGAGTYSDGKLTTRTNRPEISWLYEKLISSGADPAIAYISKPHIGSDKLQIILKKIRSRILESGSEIYFNEKVTDFIIESGKVKGVLTSADRELYSSSVVLAAGHSARDTYELLFNKGVSLEKKGFAIGTRIEHPAELIRKIQYGKSRYIDSLPPAEYAMTWNNKKTGRGVYSFCMCPGGYVINSSSEQNMLCTNGMSMSGRKGDFSNSAIVVTIRPEDTDPHPLAGVELQRQIERAAYMAGGGGFTAPAETLASFLYNKKNTPLPEVSYKNGVKNSSLDEFLPQWIVQEIKSALPNFNNMMKGFARDNGIFIGAETRTSSPVRITRGKDFQSINTTGLFAAGEGAGYSGGIVSSAIDGIRCADVLIELMS